MESRGGKVAAVPAFPFSISESVRGTRGNIDEYNWRICVTIGIMGCVHPHLLGSLLVFSLLYSLLVYLPSRHEVRGNGL